MAIGAVVVNLENLAQGKIDTQCLRHQETATVISMPLAVAPPVGSRIPTPVHPVDDDRLLRRHVAVIPTNLDLNPVLVAETIRRPPTMTGMAVARLPAVLALRLDPATLHPVVVRLRPIVHAEGRVLLMAGQAVAVVAALELPGATRCLL